MNKTEAKYVANNPTPGPWTATGSLYRRITGADNRIVATLDNLPTDEMTDEELAANHRLIAAAPELLAALTHVLDRATMPGFLRDEVKSAIAKATGA